MAPPGQRRALGALFSVLALMFAGIAYTAAAAGAVRGWVVAVAAGAIGLWLAGLSIRAFRAN